MLLATDDCVKMTTVHPYGGEPKARKELGPSILEVDIAIDETKAWSVDRHS